MSVHSATVSAGAISGHRLCAYRVGKTGRASRMNVALYVRVSSKEQTTDNLSASGLWLVVPSALREPAARDEDESIARDERERTGLGDSRGRREERPIVLHVVAHRRRSQRRDR